MIATTTSAETPVPLPSRGVRLARFVFAHGFYAGWLAAGVGMTVHDAYGLAAMMSAATAMGVAWGCAKEAATRP